MCKNLRGSAALTNNDSYRLPRHVLPESYQITLAPDLAAATFSGEVAINVHIDKPTKEIVLNAVDLAITQAIITRDNGTEMRCGVVLNNETERATIKVNGAIGKGDWTIHLSFRGTLNDKLKGFYRSTYKNAQDANQVIATTQFESTDARRAFPCFDEPDMKAIYQLTMVVDENLAVVSNSLVVSEKIVEPARIIHHEGEIVVDDNGLHYEGGYETVIPAKKAVVFAPTMKMSTYIVAFVVGDLVATDPINVDGTAVRVWCVPGKEHLATFALETAQFALRYFNKYFGVSYPGDKLDMLAIPDFAAGAMENLGCVTFRENALLIDAAAASQASLDWVAEVVAHELAHMWFGDLVTMRWWNGIWLNEAFATFMAAKCVDAFKQDWGVWDKFGLSRGTAFRIDGLATTRPVEFTVNHPDEAQGMFDVLTYEKGGSVMRMLEQFLGEETFQRGIAQYISSHAYGNTETTDLWNALETASGQPVSQIMHGWIFNPGYPVLSVNKGRTAGSITLKQQRFTYLPLDSVDQLWQVPVLLRYKSTSGVHELKHLLTADSETIYLDENVEWVVVNAGGHGFYRVIYSPELRAQLTLDLQTTLTVIERVNLLIDSWACVQAGLNTSIELLELAKVFASENDPNVWKALTGPLAAIRRLLPTTHRDKFEIIVRELIGPVLTRLGWQAGDNESSQVSELRGDLFATLALTGDDKQAQAKARELFASWKNDPASVDGNVIGAVVTIVAANGDTTVYDEYYSLFKNAKTPEDSERFLYALASFRQVALLERTMQSCLSAAEIRTQDSPSVLARIVGSEVGGAYAWQFIKDHWDTLVKLYPDSGIVGLARATATFNTPEQEADVKEFLSGHPVKGAGKAIEQTLELLHIGVLLRQREATQLAAAFTPDTDSDTATDDIGDGSLPAEPPAIEPGD